MDTEEIKAYIFRKLAALRGIPVESVDPLDFISTKEAATICRFENTQSVRNEVQKKKLIPHMKMGTRLYFTWAGLENYLSDKITGR